VPSEADGAQDYQLSKVDARRIAEAFELTREEVSLDASLQRGWMESQSELMRLLQERHQWDATVPDIYLRWLRGLALDTDTAGL